MSKAPSPFATVRSAIMLMAASIAPNTGFVNWREANMFRWALCVTLALALWGCVASPTAGVDAGAPGVGVAPGNRGGPVNRPGVL